MRIPILGGSYKGRSADVNSQRSINIFPSKEGHGDKSELIMYGTPGYSTWKDTGEGPAIEIRGMHVFGDYLYVVVGDKLLKITTGRDITDISTDTGTTLGTSTGPVYMTNNSIEMLIADGTAEGYLYTYSTDGFVQIVDVDFPGAQSCECLDSYFIVNEPDNTRVYISASDDGTSWDALDFRKAEGRLDKTVRVLAYHKLLWVFCEETTEVWYNTGAEFPFQNYPSGFIEKGIIARGSAVGMDQTVYWLSNEITLLRANGFRPERISTRQIEYQWAQYSTVSDAIAYSYVEEGHVFYVITFPKADATWCFDAATNEWHERSSGLSGARHVANNYAYFNLEHLIGDYTSGIIHSTSLDTYTENGSNIKRTRVSQTIHAERKNMFIHALELDIESGVGINPGYSAWAVGTTYASGDKITYGSGLDIYKSLQNANTGNVPDTATAWWDEQLQEGNNPQAVLTVSVDGGHTWSNEIWRSMGKIGVYEHRTKFWQLGMGRQFNFKIEITDKVKIVFIGGVIEASVGLS